MNNMDSYRSKWTAYYQSPWEIMYSDSDFLIGPVDVAIAKEKRVLIQEQIDEEKKHIDEEKQQIDEEDKEILQLLSSLDNGSSNEDATDDQNTDWDTVVAEFKSAYTISWSHWNDVLKHVKQLQRAQPAKKFTCQELVAIARDIKRKRCNDKQEQD